MEFFQFHPTSLYTGPGGACKKSPGENAFLISEAVRGHGGRLYNSDGERFMGRYDERLELAPRDVVARAIDREIKAAVEAGREAACVYLDVSHLPAEDVRANFPGIAAELESRGVDMAIDRIPRRARRALPVRRRAHGPRRAHVRPRSVRVRRDGVYWGARCQQTG